MGSGQLVWVKINGKDLPTPTEFTPVYSDFDSSDSVRNEVGYLNRTIIRRGQVAPKYKWILNGLELSNLLKTIEPDTLDVEYYDPKERAWKQFKGYAQATRTPKMFRQHNTFDTCLWEFECSFIEY